MWWFFLLFLSLLSLSSAADDTQLVPTSGSSIFPQCAVSCSLLKQAQDGCVPPAAIANGKATYVSCFCQSALITQLHTSADGTCDSTCSSASDRALLKKWYGDYCSSGGTLKADDSSDNNNNNNENSNNNDNNNDGNKNDDSKGDAAASSASTDSASSDNAAPAPPSWISTHYQWIIMVVVLIVGFTALTILGVWLKRRHDAKYPGLYHATAGGSASDSSTFFGRGQASSPVPATTQYQYQYPVQPVADTSTSHVEQQVQQVQPPPPPRSPARLQKGAQAMGGADEEIREIGR